VALEEQYTAVKEQHDERNEALQERVRILIDLEKQKKDREEAKRVAQLKELEEKGIQSD
jgi:hypothetical protein